MRILTPSSRWLIVAAVAAIAVGCKKKGPDPDTPGPAPAVAHTGPPLTGDDYREFGAKLERAVAEGDKTEVDRLVRVLDLVERSAGDLQLTPSERKGLSAGASRSTQQFSQQFIDAAKAGGSYSVVRVRTVNDRPRILLRLIPADGGVDYHEYSLARYPDGRVATEDIYIYSMGESLTETFRRVLLGLLPAGNRGALDRLSGGEKLMARHIGDLTTMTAQVRGGQHREGLATFRRLPAELQKHKVFQLIAVHAAQGSGDEAEYLAEMERFRRDHPNDPAADLLSIDYHLLKKQYDEALNGIDRLDKAVGGDPFLDALRASGLMELRRYEEARAAAERAVEALPKMLQGYMVRAAIAAEEKDHADTLVWLRKLVEVAEQDPDPADLTADEGFAEFVKSPQFAEFKKWVAARKK
jgi:tetratricopeptide (TPR) repeat protein